MTIYRVEYYDPSTSLYYISHVEADTFMDAAVAIDEKLTSAVHRRELVSVMKSCPMIDITMQRIQDILLLDRSITRNLTDNTDEEPHFTYDRDNTVTLYRDLNDIAHALSKRPDMPYRITVENIRYRHNYVRIGIFDHNSEVYRCIDVALSDFTDNDSSVKNRAVHMARKIIDHVNSLL